jgi:DNA-binding beta-propeller fold protein YncE
MWGFFGQTESPDAMWGPRDVTINAQGHIIITDTGNKRVVVFDPDGNVITEIGEAGLALGQFDEPVGLAVGPDDHLYVADTWNQRIQVFNPPVDDVYLAINSWDIVGWYGQSLDNKPFLAVNSKGHIFATDPEGYRVLEFTPEGEFVRYFGNLSSGPDGFGLVGGIATELGDGVWVADPGNNRIMHFTLP